MQKRRNNKGFSLVELIIVIAIMLVLVGILVPQFVKYVQRARVAADVASAQELAEAIQAMIADGEINNIAGPNDDLFKHVYYMEAGDSIQGIDGITEIPESKINKDNLWYIAYNADGEVFVGVIHRTNGLSWIDADGWILYPEYRDDWEYPYMHWPYVKG